MSYDKIDDDRFTPNKKADRIAAAIHNTLEQEIRKEGGLTSRDLKNIVLSLVINAICAAHNRRDAARILAEICADIPYIFESLPSDYVKIMGDGGQENCFN